MRTLFSAFLIFTVSINILPAQGNTILIEAESFSNKGGWVIDQQFMDVMGSPFLMAHGLGEPVRDAHTNISIAEAGKYFIYVRTRNWNAEWTEGHAAGKFQIALDGITIDKIFGTDSKSWDWSSGGTVNLEKKKYDLSLIDLTGFNGRCDAIILTKDASFTPPHDISQLSQFRKEKLGIEEAEDGGTFDFVVIGGGIAGTCAAISAARLGVKVALIQNRPVLGGNNSSEVRVHLGARINLEPYPNLGNLVNEIGPERGGNAQPKGFYEDDKKILAVLAEDNISMFLNYHVNKVISRENKILTTVNQLMHRASNLRNVLCLREFQAVCFFGWRLYSLLYPILLSEF